MKDVRTIYVQTMDSWFVDVWWLVEDTNGKVLSFPLGATGETEVLDRFRRLEGFEVKGMNSLTDATFECWRAPN